MTLQSILHYFLHFIFPIMIAKLLFQSNWKQVAAILLATMLIDVDHLFSSPMFLQNRCSIGYHALHKLYMIPFYIALLFFPKPYKFIGLGLCLHILTDYIDCWFTVKNCIGCVIHESVKNLFY